MDDDRSDLDFWVPRHQVRKYWKMSNADLRALTYREYTALLRGMVEEIEERQIAQAHR